MRGRSSRERRERRQSRRRKAAEALTFSADHSLLLQVLQSTGEWLATDMGYRAYSVDWAVTPLYRPFVAVYYGCAYLNWLSTYKGRQRGEEFMVRGYNGGPGGAEQVRTERYWEKYLIAKQVYINYLQSRGAVSATNSNTSAVLSFPSDSSTSPFNQGVLSKAPPKKNLTVLPSQHTQDPQKQEICSALRTSGNNDIRPSNFLPGWTYWEERASSADIAELWNDPVVSQQWRKAGENPGRVRFCRDDNLRPYLTKEELKAVAEIIVRKHFLGKGLDKAMLCALAEAGSMRMVDAGMGIMQVAPNTARWLFRDLSFTAYALDGDSDMRRPFTSMYFGAAYVSWLLTNGGVPRGEEFTVMAFKGGPGGAGNEVTRKFYLKYCKAKQLYAVR